MIEIRFHGRGGQGTVSLSFQSPFRVLGVFAFLSLFLRDGYHIK